MPLANMVEYAETRLTEMELEADDNSYDWDINGADEARVRRTSQKLHNLILNFTTGEANAIFRRVRGRNGFLASR